MAEISCADPAAAERFNTQIGHALEVGLRLRAYPISPCTVNRKTVLTLSFQMSLDEHLSHLSGRDLADEH
jgi:hypothetical protein